MPSEVFRSFVDSSSVHLGREDGDELGEGQTDRGRGHEPRVRVVEAGLGGDLLGVVAAHAVQGVGQALAGEIGRVSHNTRCTCKLPPAQLLS